MPQGESGCWVRRAASPPSRAGVPVHPTEVVVRVARGETKASLTRMGAIVAGVPLLTTCLTAFEARPQSGPERQAQSPRSTLEQEINPNGYTSARVCGSCHVNIYTSWKRSLHAFSLADPIFDAAFLQALKHGGERVRELCLRCHAPITMVNKDYYLTEGVTNEGVSCDFCHTVTEVHLENPSRPFSTEPGLVKRSVLRHAASPKHQVAYSQLHEKAELCGACHNYVTPDGASVMSTYEEWLKGPYSAEGKQCQNCHMVLSPGRIVSDDVKKNTQEQFHRHSLIHDSEQIRGALAVEIISTTRTADGIDVSVLVENVGSGHMVPTGMPSREIQLKVEARVEDRVWTRDIKYHKVVADKSGNILTQDWECMLKGALIVSDNRIAPREKRVERFSFVVPKNRSVHFTATAIYLYRPMLLQQRNIDIECAKAERTAN